MKYLRMDMFVKNEVFEGQRWWQEGEGSVLSPCAQIGGKSGVFGIGLNRIKVEK
jgi:hypothetical protein